MTEQEWQGCCDPQLMLLHLRANWRQLGWSETAGARKLRLLACACCRNLHPSFGKLKFEAAEKYADGLISLEDLEEAERVSGYEEGTLPPYWPETVRVWAGEGTSIGQVEALLNRIASMHRDGERVDVRILFEIHHQVTVLRDIFGKLFHSVALDPAWLAWNNATVPRLAESIYTDRAFDRLPILADALEDAGCTDLDILAHCRGPGPHVRGCWVLDFLTGKE